MRRVFPLVLSVLLVAGCAGSPPVKYYTLESAAAPTPLAQLPDLSIGLGPVLLPDVLDRSQIVTRDAPHSLEKAELHRWGGDLKDNLERYLRHRLMGLLGTQRIYHYPWPRRRSPDYQVRIDVLRFDGQPGGEVQLSGDWALLDAKERKELQLKAFSLRETAAGPEYRDLVAVMSILSDRLAEMIAEAVVVQESSGGEDTGTSAGAKKI